MNFQAVGKVLLWSAFLTVVSLPLQPEVLAQVSAQDQQAIAKTREMAIQAINTRDFSKIEPYLHPTFAITTVDNRFFSSAKAFEEYWNQQLTGPVKNITMDVKVDTVRTFLSPETEIAYGEANARFEFKDGNAATMPMRWTAVVQKFQGKWTLQSLHFSSNLLDNPVLDGSQRLRTIWAIAAGIGGVVLGAAGMGLLRRHPKPSATGE